MDIALQKCYVLLLLLNLKTREDHVQFDHRSSLALSSSPDCWATSWRRARLYVGGVSPVGDCMAVFQRVVTGGVGAVLASWAAASRWRGHLLTVRSTALLLLSGCVVGDEGLVLLVCLTFVSLVRGVLGRGEEGAGTVDINAVARFWNKRTLRCCCRLCVCVRQQGIAGTSLGWDSRPSCVVLFGDSFCCQQPLIGLRC